MNSFPFSAIVGQPQLKAALMLCAVDPSLGGVLIRGDKGTAKSTAARALADVLPPITRVAGCAFNCLPGMASTHCEVCNAVDVMPVLGPVPFVTLPLGATEDRVIGTLDLERALKGATGSFKPGLLASAHRGILYVDEVNLLQDHLVDVLLDAAAMGVNSVQREGLSVTHPARFTLIGTMNLEEGDLRPQLLDRFGLMVDVVAPREKTLRADVVRRRIAFEADPIAYLGAWSQQQNELRRQLVAAQNLFCDVVLSDALLELISHLCCEFDVASLRADIVMHKTARALAALAERHNVTAQDVRDAAELVLPHRRRRKPFEQTGLDRERLDELMQQALSNQESAEKSGEMQSESSGSGGSTDSTDSTPENPQQVFAAASSGQARHITTQSSYGSAGRRSQVSNATRGNMVRAVPDMQPTSLALGATLRSAALRNPVDFAVVGGDLHQQIRVGKTANLVLFVVDASGSMAAQRRMEAIKGAVLALLTDAYQQRDEVAVIAFRGEAATLLLPPTRSVDLAQECLHELPTGGRTPLPHALQLVIELLDKKAREAGNAQRPPLLVILSDGKGNVALRDQGDAWGDTLALAEVLAARAVPALVIDTETGYLRLGQAAQLAQSLGAECLTLEDLSAENLLLTLRSRMRASCG
jgi:magnesium chelatase subunit D